MQQRNNILKEVKNYIDNELNPSKKNFLDSTKEDYEELKSIDEILASRNFKTWLWRGTFNFWWHWFSDTLQKATKFIFCE